MMMQRTLRCFGMLVAVLGIAQVAMAGTPVAPGHGALPPLTAGTSTELILDASGSMKSKIQGKEKLVQAKRVFHAYMTEAAQENVHLALRVYGLREKDCKDSHLVLKFGQTGSESIDSAMDQVNPKGYGKTPLAYSLELAAKDLAKQPKPRRIVVITDGIDTCGGDPCAVAKKLKKNYDVRIYVVTYNVSPKDQKKLSCLGKETGGSTTGAVDTFSLLRAVAKTDHSKKNLYVRSPDPMASADVFRKVKGKLKVLKRFISSLGTILKPGTYEVRVNLKNTPYWFRRVVIPPKKIVILKIEGNGVIEVHFMGKLMQVEVQNVNGAKVKMSTTDTDIPVKTGYYKLKIFALPFAQMTVDDVTVLPGRRFDKKIARFGVLRTQVPGRTSMVPLGYYVFDERKKNDMGSYISGLPLVLPVGTYTIKSADGVYFKHVRIMPKRYTSLIFRPAPGGKPVEFKGNSSLK